MLRAGKRIKIGEPVTEQRLHTPESAIQRHAEESKVSTLHDKSEYCRKITNILCDKNLHEDLKTR